MDSEIYNTLINLSSSERTDAVRKLAQHYNCSVSTIWRKANEMGIRARGERSTKGETKVDEWILEHVAALIAKSGRLNGKYTFSAKDAYRHMTQDLGVVIDVGYQRFTKLLKQRGFTVKEFKTPAPHVQLLSEHPNQLHEFDVSICTQWYFDKKTEEVEERDTKTTEYKNKMEKTVIETMIDKPKLHRFVIVDHCSGAFFFWYYYSNGENSIDGADFLFKAWSGKKQLIKDSLGADYDGAYMFKGVPKILYTDKGAILRSKALRNLMASLKVDVKFHDKGNPRAKGMVEGLMNIIEEKFESYLRIYSIQSIEKLNAYALKWCIERNLMKDFRGAEVSRMEYWRKIKEDQFLKCPPYDVWAMLIQPDPVTRKVDGSGTIEFNGRKYTIADTNAFYGEVVVRPNAYESPAIDAHFDGNVYTLHPNPMDEYGRTVSPNSVKVGEYKTLKPTETQKFSKKAEEIMSETYGSSFKGKGNKRRMTPPTKPAPEALLTTDNIVHLQPQGKDIDINPHEPLTRHEIKPNILPKYTLADKLIPLTEILRQYTAEYGRVTPDERDRLNNAFPAGVPMSVSATDIRDFLAAPVINIAKRA